MLCVVFGMDAVLSSVLSRTNQLDPGMRPLTIGSVAWEAGSITRADSEFYSLRTRLEKTDFEKARQVIGTRTFCVGGVRRREFLRKQRRKGVQS